MRNVLGALTLLVAVSVGLFLLYTSSGQLTKPIPVAPLGLVSAPLSAPPLQSVVRDPTKLENVRELARVPAGTNRLQIPADLIQPGQCFYVTAYDTSGNESEPSAAICLEEPTVESTYSGPCGSCHGAV